MNPDSRDSLGRRLREIRKKKGLLSPKEFCGLLPKGYSVSGVLKRERGEIKIDVEYVTDFCKALSIVGKEKAKLLDLLKLFLIQFDPWRSSKSEVLELQLDFWKRLLNSNSFIEFEPTCICGLLQCENYRYEMLKLHGVDRDSAISGATQRVTQSRTLIEQLSEKGNKSKVAGLKSIKLVTDESALYRVVGSKQTMIEQLEFLNSIKLPASIEHRILPMSATLNVPPIYSFSLFDDSLALMETATGAVYSSNIEGINWLTKVFDSIFPVAISGAESVTLIKKALSSYE